MNGGKVEIKHPAQPESCIVGGFLLFIVMPDSEVVCNIEQVIVIG